MIRHYDISVLRQQIAWSYLFHAWGITTAGDEEKAMLRSDAEAMLDKWQGVHRTHALIERRQANANGDDIIIEGTVFPMLRQQSGNFLCLADYIKPAAMGPDVIGLFATTTDRDIAELSSSDPYERMMAQTIADRLAEATAEMVSQEMPGIRPAPGYPSMPDTSINFLIDGLIDFSRIGISLTESGMMMPHASVSGLIFSHPKAQYFNITAVGDDQLRDYAARRGFPSERMRSFIRQGTGG